MLCIDGFLKTRLEDVESRLRARQLESTLAALQQRYRNVNCIFKEAL